LFYTDSIASSPLFKYKDTWEYEKQIWYRANESLSSTDGWSSLDKTAKERLTANAVVSKHVHAMGSSMVIAFAL
jgi:hypothetical protein